MPGIVNYNHTAFTFKQKFQIEYLHSGKGRHMYGQRSKREEWDT